MHSVSSATSLFEKTSNQNLHKEKFSNVLRDIELRGKYENIANLILEKNFDEAVNLLKERSSKFQLDGQLFKEIFTKCAGQRPDIKNSQELFAKVFKEVTKDFFSKVGLIALASIGTYLALDYFPVFTSSSLAAMGVIHLCRPFAQKYPATFKIMSIAPASFLYQHSNYTILSGLLVGAIAYESNKTRIQTVAKFLSEHVIKDTLNIIADVKKEMNL